MHMFHSASLKLGLERAVLSQNRDAGDNVDDRTASGVAKKKSEREAHAKEIDSLLKKGAYDVFRDEDDKEAEKFMETDIDQLLEHSAKKVTYGASATSSIGSGLGSFSKASFVTNTEDGERDVDLDDPDFWSKAVGLDVPPEGIPEEVAHMLDDGVKRSRKQVQVYDPYADTVESDQRKRGSPEDGLIDDERESKDGKKKKKSADSKDRRKGDYVVHVDADGQPVGQKALKDYELKNGKLVKKTKKGERLRALRRAENADPMFERLKQGWEATQRHRVIAAAIRFGFPRFCKLRSESNLTSLPLQDLEVFLRSLIYQLGVQVAASFMQMEPKDGQPLAIRSLLHDWLGGISEYEFDWMVDSISTAASMQLSMCRQDRDLRLPVILAEPHFLCELKNGAALRALRRICLLSRLNHFIDECLDSALSALGIEALGRRGCTVTDFSVLDPDLKARYVTSEELALAVSARLESIPFKSPTAWWDRSCDIGLIIGSFVHGLGSYEALRNDPDLPFHQKSSWASMDFRMCTEAVALFDTAAHTVKRVLDETVGTTPEATNGGSKNEAKVGSPTGETATLSSAAAPKQTIVKRERSKVTLTSLKTCLQSEMWSFNPSQAIQRIQTSSDSATPDETCKHELPMPDSRVLNVRLLKLLDSIDTPLENQKVSAMTGVWEASDSANACSAITRKELRSMNNDYETIEHEYTGIGLGSRQCGTSHRSLNDGTDYYYGHAHPQLSNAVAVDVARSFRGPGVPMTFTRFVLSGLIHADTKCINEFLSVRTIQGTAPGDIGSEESIGERVPKLFRQSPELRTHVCLTLLRYGFPTPSSAPSEIKQELLEASQCVSSAAFSVSQFFKIVERQAYGCEMPDELDLILYVQSYFLPFCLRLCLSGNGEDMCAFRGDERTPNGFGLQAEPSKSRPCPIPDPCFAPQEHSLEAIGHANAILRRVRLLQTSISISTGSLSSKVVDVAKSDRMGNLKGMPQWWCPWVHDVALLVCASTDGVFGVLENRASFDCQEFSLESRMQRLRQLFSRQKSDVPTVFCEKVEKWIEAEAEAFPSSNLIERRLAFLCSGVTAICQDETRFENIPMFDHGGWPRD